MVLLHSFYLSYPSIRAKIFSCHTLVGCYQIKHESKTIKVSQSPLLKKGSIDIEAGIDGTDLSTAPIK